MALFGNAKFNDRVAQLGDLSSAVIRVDKLPDPDTALEGLTYQLADYQDKYIKNHVYTCIIRDGKAIWKDITSPYRIEHLPAVGSNDFGNDFANSKCYMANLYCDCDHMLIVSDMNETNRHLYQNNWRRHYREYAGTYYLFLLMASTKNKEFVEDDKWVKGQLVVKETKLPDEFPYTVEPMYFRPAVIYELTKKVRNGTTNPFGLPDVVLRTDGVIPCYHFLDSTQLGLSAPEDIFSHPEMSVSDPAYAVTPVDTNVTHDLPISTPDEEPDEQVPPTDLSDEESDKLVVLPTGPLDREKAKRVLAKWQFFGALLRKYGVARGYYKVDSEELKALNLVYDAETDNNDTIRDKDNRICDEALYIKGTIPNSGGNDGYLRIKPNGSDKSCIQLARYIDKNSNDHRDVYRYIDINSPTRIWWASGNDSVTVTYTNASGNTVTKKPPHQVAIWGYIEKYLIKADGTLTDIGKKIEAELNNDTAFEKYYEAVFSEELYPSRIEDGKVLLTYNIRHEYTQQPFIIGPLRDMDEKIVRKFRVFHTFSSGLVMYEGFQEDEYRMVHRIGAENSKWCKDALERCCAGVKRENTENTNWKYPWFNLGFDCYHKNYKMDPTGLNDNETWNRWGTKQPLFWNLVMFYEQ